ncbi:MAG: methionyl-tRNA formyltransferase [Eubacteriales bacterium]|nr:methionyl-tRNA formyltransferase [Eubacteriales bacterium]
MRILFMGTPEISAVCLRALADNGFEVIGAVTGEDKPRGRGYIMTPSAVKVTANEHDIPVFQPKTLRDEAFSNILFELRPDIIVVVAYGKILPPSVIHFPPLGCVNLHVSLLPKYRGAAPMQRAIINGDRYTGVTAMYMDEGLDTGDIIEAEKFPILDNDNFESIHDRSADVGSKLLCRVLRLIERGEATRTKQGDDFTYAAKIEKSDCIVDFNKTSHDIDCLIRGLSPIPLAFTRTPDGKLLKIVSASPTHGHGEAGEVIRLDDKNGGEGIVVATSDGAIAIKTVVPEGKGKMSSADFIRGRKIKIGDILRCI